MLRNPSLAIRVVLAVVSGVIYALAFPPVGWRWLVVPGLVGLLLALRNTRGARARGLGFLHGMVAYGTGLPWLWLLFGWFAVLLWGILAAFTAAFAWMQSRAEIRGWTGHRLVLFTAANWGAWEFIRAELFPLKFPWMTPGLALGPDRWLSLIGVYGMSVLVLFVCAALLWRRGYGAIAGVLLLGHHEVDLLRTPRPFSTGAPENIRVAGLQFENVSFIHFVDQTTAIPAGAQHVVWPEHAVPYDVRANPRDWATLQSLCRERGITLTVGTHTTWKDQPGWWNTALTLDATGVLGEHQKVHPVHFFDDGTPGTAAVPVPTAHGKIGTPICFDCDYEGVVRRMTAAGAECFIVPMMDVESWGRGQHEQHAELFRIRACENGRWFFVCGTSGVSQVIDGDGTVGDSLSALKQGMLSGEIRRETHLTPYTRWGWLTPWAVLALGSLCWIVLLLPHRAAKTRIP